jgi:L-Ala-D/L-Glu epimerase
VIREESTSIREYRLLPYRIPLRNPFITAHGSLTTREGAIVELLMANGITGVGEIAPMPECSGGNLGDALAALQQSPIVHDLVSKEPDEALEILYEVGDSLPASTVCGLEIALLDALGQARQRSVSELLIQRSLSNTAHPHESASMQSSVAPRTHMPVNAVIGASTISAAVNDAQAAIANGFGCIKLKLGLGVKADIERVYAVREAIGPSIHLRLDANEGWDCEQACAILTACTPLDIQYVEQPLKASDLTGMRRLRQAVAIPIAADEAIDSQANARRVLVAQAADVLALKPQLIGGLHICQQIMQEAAAYGVHCVITSTIETGIGVTAALHLAAASPEITLECGLATLPMLQDDLLIEDLSIHDGLLTVPTGAGLGVHLDRQALTNAEGNRGPIFYDHVPQTSTVSISETAQDIPTPLDRRLVWIMAVASAFSIANLYYVQPLLALMGQSFHLSVNQIGGVATLMQLGFAAGLLLVVPLGDRYPRRTLIVCLLVAVTIALLLVATAPTASVLSVASFFLGL